MSYIPDFRTQKNYDALNASDRSYLDGYHAAIVDIVGSLSDFVCFDDLEDIDIDILDRLNEKIAEEDQRAVMDAFLLEVSTAAIVSEGETWCGIVESADYLPEDFEPEDHNNFFNHDSEGDALYPDTDYGFANEDDTKDDTRG